MLEDNLNRWNSMGNKSIGKLDLNLENVIGIVITLEIAKGKLIYERGKCKNPERYTWNETYYYY